MNSRPALSADSSPGVCANCHQLLPAVASHASSVRSLAVLGVERCGKTSWLMRGITQFAVERRVAFPLDGQHAAWQSLWRLLEFGKRMRPTPALPGTGWCLDVAGESAPRRIYIYEISGADCSDPGKLARYRALQHVDSLVLVVDPFGLPWARDRYGEAARSMRPPAEPATSAYGEAHLAALMQTLSALRLQPTGARWPIAAAVVVTKLDVIGLFRHFASKDPSAETAEGACRERLTEWGFANMMRALDLRFLAVRYFACYPQGTGAFSAANPLRWLLADARVPANLRMKND